MVAGKVKSVMGLHQKSPKPEKASPSQPSSTKTTVFNRSFGVYFPRSSAQVQPKPPDVTELLKIIEELRNRESHLKTNLVQLQLLRETASIVPSIEAQLNSLNNDYQLSLLKIKELEVENNKLVLEREQLKDTFQNQIQEKDLKICELASQLEEVKSLSSSQRFHGLVKNLSLRKNNNNTTSNNTSCISNTNNNNIIISVANNNSNNSNSKNGDSFSSSSSSSCTIVSDIEVPSVSSSFVRSKVPRVPKPPPKRSLSDSNSLGRKLTDIVSAPPPLPPPPPPAVVKAVPPPPPPQHFNNNKGPPPPPPPPLPAKGGRLMTAKVKRVPEVVEFYHSLMRRDSRRDNGGGTAEVTSTSAKDLVGEIENRSAYLLAIKTDVETQGEFIRFLIKEVENAAFTDIEDVVSFVKWLDDELSYLVDERAVLKHFDWPEQKADALREAAFEYSDLKKLESEASSFRDVARQACSTTLKKMQTLLEKLEHGVYNLSRLRESATNRFKSFHIPVDWMLDTGFVSQIKLASVKLAMKYMKRVSAELEAVGGGPEEEELIVQGVRFAFRVHQFAGGFDVETMRAFEELRDKARSCQTQQQRLIC